MVEEMPWIISLLLKKRKRDYLYEIIPVISIVFLLWSGIQIDLLLIFAAGVFTVIKISLGEVLKDNVKRKPELGHRCIQQYQKYLSTFKRKPRKSTPEFYQFVKTIPLRRPMGAIYMAIIALFLIIYIWVMVITLTQWTQITSALFLFQFIELGFVYSRTFAKIFGKL